MGYAAGPDDDNVVISKQTWGPGTMVDNFTRVTNNSSNLGDMDLG
ncbi:hypothetical protein [Streptomyces sp. BA2]|nr:hypothetical protein [Streptomyces sp. BA2]